MLKLTKEQKEELEELKSDVRAHSSALDDAIAALQEFYDNLTCDPE